MGIARMSSVDYLVRHIAAGDGRTDPSTRLTRYYTADGYPPGRWHGAGLTGLAGGGPALGSAVTEAQLRRLFEEFADPVSGDRLGRQAPVKYKSRTERIADRVAKLPEEMTAADRDRTITRITEEENARPVKRAVVGFDLTFSPPKSVSALWAVADHQLQQHLYDAHRAAMNTVLTAIEEEALRTRAGTQGVRRVPTRGMIAAQFDHWDSRTGDPQLHTHVTVSNRVQGDDRIWRTIDSRALYRAAVAFSETYNVALADEVIRRTGLAWQRRDRGGHRRAAREIVVVPEELIAEFSGRSTAINAMTADLVAEYRRRHGRTPDSAALAKIRQHATLDTRPRKSAHNLAQDTDDWRRRANAVLGTDPTAWASTAARTSAGQIRLLRSANVDDADTAAMAITVVEEVSSTRSTWSRWNLTAETMRQMAAAGWQTATPQDLLALRDRIVADAEHLSVNLGAGEVTFVPEAVRNVDGRSPYAPDSPIYSSRPVLEAEERLLALADRTDGPAVPPEFARRIADRPLPGRPYALSPMDQAPAAVAVATSGRVVDVLVGPAGTGKTTSLAGVRAMWEAHHGARTVVGLAPSAQAAHVLAADLGIATDNTAQWLQQQVQQDDRRERINAMNRRITELEQQDRSAVKLQEIRDRLAAEHDRWALRAGDLLIVDEAGMAGTFALDRLAAQAAASGAKLLLVGDPYQLSAVQTGGAFGLLAAAQPQTATLTEVRRFVDADGSRRTWEEAAAAGLRTGGEQAIAAYEAHDRILDGDREDMLSAAYARWRIDQQAGRTSLLIAGDNDTVTQLNDRARTDLVVDGTVDDDRTVDLLDGTRAGRGDRIVTREIDRYTADGSGAGTTGATGRRSGGFVRNGQLWTVDKVHDDGSLTVRLLAADGTASAAAVTLPHHYVAQHVQLGYASTAHRAQGMTVDTAHTVVTTTQSREVVYVAATRGRQSNMLYVATGPEPASGDLHSFKSIEERTGADVLRQVLSQSSAEQSAHETRAAQHSKAASLVQLVAEYDDLAHIVHDRHAARLLVAAGVNADAWINDGEGFAELSRAIRAADRFGVNTDSVLPQLMRAQRDPRAAAEAVRALGRAPATAGRTAAGDRRIAGLFPITQAAPADTDLQRALSEREVAIQQAAAAALRRDRASGASWVYRLPPEPGPEQPFEQRRWTSAALTIAAFRERWGISDPRPLGPTPGAGDGIAQQADLRRAQAALAGVTSGQRSALTSSARLAHSSQRAL